MTAIYKYRSIEIHYPDAVHHHFVSKDTVETDYAERYSEPLSTLLYQDGIWLSYEDIPRHVFTQVKEVPAVKVLSKTTFMDR